MRPRTGNMKRKFGEVWTVDVFFEIVSGQTDRHTYRLQTPDGVN